MIGEKNEWARTLKRYYASGKGLTFLTVSPVHVQEKGGQGNEKNDGLRSAKRRTTGLAGSPMATEQCPYEELPGRGVRCCRTGNMCQPNGAYQGFVSGARQCGAAPESKTGPDVATDQIKLSIQLRGDINMGQKKKRGKYRKKTH